MEKDLKIVKNYKWISVRFLIKFSDISNFYKHFGYTFWHFWKYGEKNLKKFGVNFENIKNFGGNSTQISKKF